ncbi:MAG: DNA primase [Porticoccaceae bacterium]|nr:DNA primase [Porticoccaceae bacterium]|tara:strand:+ start:12325 stop:13158 length:834 start_codon:yes stop_codon:yes gene_type:complete
MQGTCPYCGNDSFVYTYEEEKVFLCHHCQRHLSYEKVIKNANMDSNDDRNIRSVSRVAVNYQSVLRNCESLSNLADNHECVLYARSRNLPDSVYSELYYCEDFGMVAEAAGIKIKGSKRLVIPLKNENNELFGVQGRSLDGSEPRYLTIMFNEDEEKIYGKHKVDLTKTFYCVEGPLDSLFLKNCIAMAGSDGLSDKYNSNAVLCFDNEPRNKQIVDKVEKYIDKGFKTVIWPDYIKEKDINDMILKGIDVQSIVEHNTYAGLAAKIKFNAWKKVNG